MMQTITVNALQYCKEYKPRWESGFDKPVYLYCGCNDKVVENSLLYIYLKYLLQNEYIWHTAPTRRRLYWWNELIEQMQQLKISWLNRKLKKNTDIDLNFTTYIIYAKIIKCHKPCSLNFYSTLSVNLILDSQMSKAVLLLFVSNIIICLCLLFKGKWTEFVGHLNTHKS